MPRVAFTMTASPWLCLIKSESVTTLLSNVGLYEHRPMLGNFCDNLAAGTDTVEQ